MRRRRRLADVMFFAGFKAAPGWMWATLALTVVNALAAALSSYGFKLFVDATVRDDANAMVVAAGLTGGLITANWFAATLDANVGFGLTDRVSLRVAARVAEHVNAVPSIEHFERVEYLRELDLIEQNQNLLSSAPRQTLTAVQNAVRGAAMIVLLGSVDPVLMLLPLFGIAPAAAEARSVRIRQRADERVSETRRLADQFFALSASVGPAKEVRLFGLSTEFATRHALLASDVARTTTRAAIRGSLLVAVGWMIFVAAFLGGMGLVLLRAVDGEVTPGAVVMVAVLAQQVRLLLTQVAGSVGELLTTARTAERVLWLEDYAHPAPEAEHRQPIPNRLRDGIRIEGVNFRYVGTDVHALRDVDLFLPKGSTVAIVGENGAGKTTLMKLLARMYEPTSGKIRVDGLDLKDLGLEEWRRRLAATLQDFVRYELVAGETVGVGDLPRIGDHDAVGRALERAHAVDVVATLERGLATQLGSSFPEGRELSAGQWQKLALGRGMMRDEPLVLILDEPTASLDVDTEHRLFERYANAARRASARNGAITILVSHRFSTVRSADLIVVLHEGRVVETGAHEELLNRQGLYAELFDLQASGFR